MGSAPPPSRHSDPPSLPRAKWPIVTSFAFTAVVALLVWGAIERDRKQTMQAWQARLSALAMERQQRVETWIGERRDDARMIAAYPSVIASLQKLPPNGESEATTSELGAHLTKVFGILEHSHNYVNISLADPDGRLVLQSSADTVPDRWRAQTARAAVEKRSLVVREVSDDRGSWWLLASIPVFARPDSRQPIGALTLLIPPTRSLWPLLMQQAAPTATGETLLVRREGDSAFFLSPVRHRNPNVGLRVSFSLKSSLAAQHALAGESLFGEFSDYRGVPVLAATRPIRNTDWGLVAKIDTAEAFESFRQEARQTVGLGVLGSLAFVGLIAAASRQQRTRTLAEQLAREKAIAEAREHYRLLSDQAHDIVLFLDAAGTIVDANRAAEAAYGYSAEELRRLKATDIRVGATPQSIAELMRSVEAGRRVFEVEHRRRDGSTFPVEVSSTATAIGGEKMFLAIVRDITERKRHEAQLERLRSLLAASREVNQMLARESDRGRLLEQTCAILQRTRGYALVWIGVPETEGCRVRSVASSGDRTYLESVIITWNDQPTGCGPTGMAIRTGEPFIVQSIASDPCFAPWRDAALARGYASSAAFPIQHGDRLYGALCIYTSTPDAFTSEKTDLLQQLAGDIGYALHALDVREQEQQANEHLRESEERFRQAVDHFPYAFVIYDRERRIQFINAQGARQSGHAEEQMLGHNDEELFPPEVTAPYLPALCQCAASRQPQRLSCTISMPGRRSDVIINYIPLLDADGEIRQILGITHDVTEIKRAAEALRQSERRIRAMLENVNLVAMTLDTDGSLTFCNNYLLQLTGWSREESLGRNWFEVFVPADARPEVEGVFRESVISGRMPPHYENEIVTRHGERRLIAWNNTVLHDSKGTFVGCMSIGEDITERKKAEEQVRRLNAELEQRVRERTAELEAANKELEAFGYSVSHDLRAPLRHIEGFIRAFEEDHGANLAPEALHYMQRVKAGSKRMGELIDALLMLSRVGRAALHAREVDLATLARTVFAERRPSDHEIELVIGELPAVRGDPTLLHQLLDNLIDNAVKFTRSTAKARIEVGARGVDDEVVFYVADNGVGFDAHYAGKLFGVFQRLHRQHEFEGTGIGLSIAKRIVEKHGGRIWAEATPDAGATFFFTLRTEKAAR